MLDFQEQILEKYLYASCKIHWPNFWENWRGVSGEIPVETPGGVPDSIPKEIFGIITKRIPVSFLENT